MDGQVLIDFAVGVKSKLLNKNKILRNYLQRSTNARSQSKKRIDWANSDPIIVFGVDYLVNKLEPRSKSSWVRKSKTVYKYAGDKIYQIFPLSTQAVIRGFYYRLKSLASFQVPQRWIIGNYIP